MSAPSPNLMKKTITNESADVDENDDIVNDVSDALAPISLKLDDKACGIRLDKVLSTLIPQYSRSRIQQWIENGFVLVDGAPGRTKMTMIGDEEVVVTPQIAPEELAFQAEEMEIDVVYEDNAIIVVNKPIGLVVHPAAGNWSGTLLNGLLHYCPALGHVPRAGIVHRLDKDTNGLMVVAKSLIAQTDLVRQLQARTVKRQYLALVWGTPDLHGKINVPMARHPKDRLKMAASQSILAKPAVTHFQRLAEGEIDGKAVSLVLCQLETGRTHQIRVHMQFMGNPLVGDALYGKAHLNKYFPRQALQAYRLGLIHPETQQPCEWEVPLADDFAELLEQAEIDFDDFDMGGEDAY
jgi:23S rRNA pseudouridine1911/1915/1917 synthase